MKKPKPIIIMIANQKGGVGKTTCTLEICNALGKQKHKVLGIDLDPQNSFSKLSGADIEAEGNLKKVLDVKAIPTDVIQHMEYFDIIPGSEELADASVIYGKTNDIWLLSDAIDIIKDQCSYDYIILDSAPGRSKLLEMEYIAADYIIAPTEPDTEAQSGLYKIKKDIVEFSKHNQSHVKFLETFMNKYKKQSNLHKAMYESLQNISEDIGAEPFETKIRDTVKVSEARINKKPIEEYAKTSGIAEDYAGLVKEIVKRVKGCEKS